MFFRGKSWSSLFEDLRLRSSALFGRQAAWRPGAFVDKLCQRRSVHLSCSSWRLSGLGVYAPKARSANSLSMARVCGSCCWSIQLFPRGQCSPARRALMGRFGLTMGRSCCGISGSSCEWSTGSYLSRGGWPKLLCPVTCTTTHCWLPEARSDQDQGRGPSQWQF